MPREMAPIKPSAFAAELIARLEKLKREQDTLSSLEERLQQIQEVSNKQHFFSTGTGSNTQLGWKNSPKSAILLDTRLTPRPIRRPPNAQPQLITLNYR